MSTSVFSISFFSTKLLCFFSFAQKCVGSNRSAFEASANNFVVPGNCADGKGVLVVFFVYCKVYPYTSRSLVTSVTRM